MADDKMKTDGADRRRVALDQPYEVEDFHQRFNSLSHEGAKRIIRETGGAGRGRMQRFGNCGSEEMQ
jgi:hypothetical protein